MQRALTRFLLMVALAAVSVWALPVLAAEEGAASDAKSDKAESGGKAEKEDGGEEGGGKKKKKGDEDVSGGRFAGDPVYVHISPLILPVISDQGVEQLVTIIIDVEVKDLDAAENLQTNMPRAKDALMRALYGGLGQGNLRKGKLADVDKIKAKATAALNEVIKDGGIRDVLIQGIAQRML